MPTCSWSGGEEHGNRGEPSKCGDGQGMLLERALLGDVVVVVREQDISRGWSQCSEPDCHQHCFAGDGAFEETDIPGEKNLSSLLFVSYLTSFTNSLQEAVPGRLFQSWRAGKQLQHVTS